MDKGKEVRNNRKMTKLECTIGDLTFPDIEIIRKSHPVDAFKFRHSTHPVSYESMLQYSSAASLYQLLADKYSTPDFVNWSALEHINNCLEISYTPLRKSNQWMYDNLYAILQYNRDRFGNNIEKLNEYIACDDSKLYENKDLTEFLTRPYAGPICLVYYRYHEWIIDFTKFASVCVERQREIRDGNIVYEQCYKRIVIQPKKYMLIKSDSIPTDNKNNTLLYVKERFKIIDIKDYLHL